MTPVGIAILTVGALAFILFLVILWPDAGD